MAAIPDSNLNPLTSGLPGVLINIMAIVRRLEHLALEMDTAHTEADCTYSIVHDDQGHSYLQIDTYGSKVRQIPGKKSQSIRFAPEAIEQLKALLAAKF